MAIMLLLSLVLVSTLATPSSSTSSVSLGPASSASSNDNNYFTNEAEVDFLGLGSGGIIPGEVPDWCSPEVSGDEVTNQTICCCNVSDAINGDGQHTGVNGPPYYFNETGANCSCVYCSNDASAFESVESYVGAGVSVFGNLCISFSLNIQKYAHNKIKDLPEDVKVSYLSSKYWWFGIILMVFGECGNFGAYVFAPAVLVAPLGTVTVVSNAIIAPCVFGEQFRKRDAAGVVLAAVGAMVIVLMAPKTDHGTDSLQCGVQMDQYLYGKFERTEFIVYFCFLLVSGAVAFVANWKGYGAKIIYVPLYMSAVLGSFTVLSVKAVTLLFRATIEDSSSCCYPCLITKDNSNNKNMQFGKPLIYIVAAVLAFTAVTQVKYLNVAMQHFDATQVVPTFFIMFTLGAILVGGIFYEDFQEEQPQDVVGFIGGVMMAFIGVYLITSRRNSAEKPKYDSLINEDLITGKNINTLQVPLNSRDRADSGASLSGLSPFAGIETTPLIKQKAKSKLKIVNHSNPNYISDVRPAVLSRAGTDPELLLPKGESDVSLISA